VRLPAVRSRQLIRVLERKGWRLARSKGSHHHFTHSDSPNVVTVPVHARDIKRGTLSGILAGAHDAKSKIGALCSGLKPDIRLHNCDRETGQPGLEPGIAGFGDLAPGGIRGRSGALASQIFWRSKH